MSNVKKTQQWDRGYWESIATTESMQITDSLLQMIIAFAPELEENPTKQYIGLKKNDKAYNFAVIEPKKTCDYVRLKIKRLYDRDFKLTFEEAGFSSIGHNGEGQCKMNVNRGNIRQNRELLTRTLKSAYDKFRDMD